MSVIAVKVVNNSAISFDEYLVVVILTPLKKNKIKTLKAKV